MHRVEFVLGYSRLLLILMSVAYGGGVLILATLPVFLLLKIGVIAFLVFKYKQILQLQVFRRAPGSVIKIWQDTKDRWGCHFRYGLSTLGELHGSSFKSTWLIILKIKAKNRIINVLIPRDTVSIHEFRELLLRLNTH